MIGDIAVLLWLLFCMLWVLTTHIFVIRAIESWELKHQRRFRWSNFFRVVFFREDL